MKRGLLAISLAVCACSQLLGLDDAVIEAETRQIYWATPSVVLDDAEVGETGPSMAPDTAPDVAIAPDTTPDADPVGDAD